MTPLHWAVENNHVNVATIIINNGAEIDVIDKVSLVIRLYNYSYNYNLNYIFYLSTRNMKYVESMNLCN